MLEFQLLGSIEVRVDGRPVEIGPSQRRALLAMLLIDRGQTVSVETLAQRLWDDNRPPSARQVIYTHMSRLRHTFQSLPDPGNDHATLVRRSSGYLLDVTPEAVDVHRLRSLVHEARRADGSEALPALRAAVAGCGAEPLADLTGGWATRIRAAWSQYRLETTLLWARTELRHGDPAMVSGPLMELAEEFPLAESVTAVLMLALARTGRTGDALHTFAMARERLVVELGVDPGEDLAAAHQSVLAGTNGGASRALAAPTEPAGPTEPAAPTEPDVPAGPALLPAAAYGFVGRLPHLAILDSLLADATGQRTCVVISTLSGPAGVGKTALAVHWAQNVRHRFPDGQLFVNLHGFGPTRPPMAARAALRRFLHALDVPAARIPADVDEMTDLYRSTVGGRRMLVVLDNAAHVDQVRPLLPGSPGSFVLVTSRTALAGLVAEGARPLRLDPLTDAEAHELLVDRLGSARTAAEPNAVCEIIGHCAKLPLALTVVAARLAVRPTRTLAAAADQLRGTGHRLDELNSGGGGPDVRTAFFWSYTTLSPAAARLFRLTGLMPVADLGLTAMASLAGVPVDVAATLLDELDTAGLVVASSGRYGSHDLLRAYAAELTHGLDTTDDRDAAGNRLREHVEQTAITAALLINPARENPPSPSGSMAGVHPEPLRSAPEALAWFVAEHHTLLAVTQAAAGLGEASRVEWLAWSLADYLDRQGHWQDWIDVLTLALNAGAPTNGAAGRAKLHRNMGRANTLLRRHATALHHLSAALDLYGRIGDLIGQAHTRVSIAQVHEQEDRLRDALADCERARVLYQRAGHRGGLANTLNAIGWYRTLLGESDQAPALCEQALAIFEELGIPEGQAAALDTLGLAHHNLGHHTEAAEHLGHAADLFDRIGDRFRTADTLDRLADTNVAIGDDEGASRALRRAHRILVDLNHPRAQSVESRLRQLKPAERPMSPALTSD